MLCSGIFPKGVISLTRFWCSLLLYRYSGYLQTGILVNSEDPDEMKHYAPVLFERIKTMFRERNA